MVSRIHSKLALVANGIALQYADHPVEPDDGFADFNVHVKSPAGIRRWFQPQVLFQFDSNTPFSPLPAAQAFPMLEWGLNWCVSSYCNQYLCIHAAVIEKNGRAAILPAPPGSGKSTLSAGLICRGWRLLSDELTLIDPSTGRIIPLVRPVSLKNASIDVIRRFSPDSVFSPGVKDTVKGTVAHMKPPIESVRRAFEPAQPGWMILPRYQAGAPARLAPLSKGQAFMQLAENAFNYSLHGRRGFETLANLIDTSGCYEFTYSRLEEAVDVFETLANT